MSCLICLPMYGFFCMEPFFRSMMGLVQSLERSGFDYEITTGADSAVHRNRYFLTQSFMESGFDRLMFIDSDLEFTPEDFGKIWALDADIGVGVYAMKKEGAPYAAHVDGKMVMELPEKPFEVDYAGTGFMMIKRHVFEALKDDLMWIETVKGNIPRWFDFPVVKQPDGKQVELPEDYALCYRARQKGFKVVMDPTVKLKHYGLKGYG